MIYLLHFDRPICDTRTTQHYLGFSRYVPARALAHLQGRGARLTQVARQRNIGFVIAAIFPGDRSYERLLKNRRNHRRLCPICRGACPAPSDDLL